MCYPMLIMAAGAIVSAVGQIQQGKAADNYAEANANMKRQQAADAKERGELEAAKARRKGAQMKGRQMAQFAASGLSIMADGTTGDILADTEMFTELDALTSINNAEKESFFHEYSARNELAMGKAKKKGSYLSAAGTLLMAAGSMGSSYNDWSGAKDAGGSLINEGKGFGDFLLS